MISLILVQHGSPALTQRAITSIQQTQTASLEIILVDNATPGFDARLFQQQFPSVRLLGSSENEGFGRANNRAAALAGGEILLFLNTDTECRTDFGGRVEKLFRESPSLGVLGPRLVNEDGSFQLSAGKLPGFLREIQDKLLYRSVRRGNRAVRRLVEQRFRTGGAVGWVTGAAMFVRKDLFDLLGGFDEKMFMYFEDKDLCARAWKAGCRVMYDPSIIIMHLKAGSTTAELSPVLAREYRASQRYYYSLHRPGWEQLLLSVYQRALGQSVSIPTPGMGQ